MVKEDDDDGRRNKYADFSISKMKDSLTCVVIEAKLNISETVNYGMRNDVAQLVLETIYSDQQENNRQEKTLCALTNGTTWHIFVMNMRTRPARVRQEKQIPDQKALLILYNLKVHYSGDVLQPLEDTVYQELNVRV